MNTKARVIGAFYLLTILAAAFSEGFVTDRIVVWGSAATTASNMLAHATLVRAGYAVYLIEMIAQIVTAVLFYELLTPVNKSLARLSAVLEISGCGIKTMSRLFFLISLLVLSERAYASVFNTEQLQSISLLMLRINDQGAAIALVFFGFATILQGYLIMKSTFLPRWLGVWAMIAGLGWLTWLSPPLGLRLFPYVAPVAPLGALVMIGWLLVAGVNEQRWREQAAA